MRIDSSSLIQRLQGVRQADPARRTGEVSGPSDAVEISSLAADMKVAMDALNEAPETDPEQEARLDALQRQLDSGEFHLDSGSLASKLIP